MHLRCDEISDDHNIIISLHSPAVKEFLKSVNIAEFMWKNIVSCVLTHGYYHLKIFLFSFY